MKIRSLLIAGAMCMTYCTQAQFVNSYGSPMFETARGIQQTVAGNYILAGWNAPGPFGGGDATLMLSNPAGGYLPPTSVYGGGGQDHFYSAREVTFGGAFAYVAAGHTNSFGFGGDDIYFAGTTPALGCAFQATLGGPGTDRAYCIQQVTDAFYGNCFAIVGETNSFPGLGGRDVYMALISPAGGLLTASIIGTPADEVGHWIEQTSDGGYIITGYSTNGCAVPAPDPSNIYVVKMAPTPGTGTLTVAWNHIVTLNPGASQSDMGYCVKEDPSMPNNFIVVGETNSWGAGGYDAFVMSINAGGVATICTWGEINNDRARGLHITAPISAGGYIVSGYTDSWNQPAPDMSAFLFKMSPLCNVVTEKVYMPNNGSPDFGYELTTSDVPGGGIAMVGETQMFTPGNPQNFLVETDLALNTFTACEQVVSGILDSPPVCVISNTQAVPVTGFRKIPCGYINLNWVMNACPAAPPAAAKMAGATSENMEFLTLSPNPSSSQVSIAYSETYSGSVLKMTDVQGRLISKRTLAGTGNETLDVTRLAPGIYFISVLKPDGSSEMIRFVKSE